MNKQQQFNMRRRGFIGTLSAGAAAMGMSMLTAPVRAAEKSFSSAGPGDEAEEWFKKIKGKHRIVFDAVHPNGIMTFAWPRVFLITNTATGSPEKDCGVVVILRHDSIPFALGDDLWAKYKFGETLKINDPVTQAPAIRNPFWKPGPHDYKVPGIGDVSIGINELQQSGVMFCGCNMALMVESAVTAMEMKMDATEVYKEWVAGVLPGIQVVPSGVWAVNRAQEHGCAYCFAG